MFRKILDSIVMLMSIIILFIVAVPVNASSEANLAHYAKVDGDVTNSEDHTPTLNNTNDAKDVKSDGAGGYTTKVNGKTYSFSPKSPLGHQLLGHHSAYNSVGSRTSGGTTGPNLNNRASALRNLINEHRGNKPKTSESKAEEVVPTSTNNRKYIMLKGIHIGIILFGIISISYIVIRNY